MAHLLPTLSAPTLPKQSHVLHRHNTDTKIISEKLTETAPSSTKDNANAPDQSWHPTSHLGLAFSALAVLTLVVALDSTSISVALPKIAEELHGTALESFWAGTSSLLASTVLQLTFASLSYIFGRVRVVMLSLLLFLAGVLLASLSQTFGMLLLGRTIQGAGGGGIMVLVEIMVTDLVPLRYRGQWYGIIAAMWACGSVSGPVIGGSLANVQWRWIFWINLPFIFAALIMIPWFLRLNLSTPTVAGFHRVDWIGSIIFICSTTALIAPLTYGGVLYPWRDLRTFVPILLSFVGLLAFCLHEYYFAFQPIVRFPVFSNTSANIAFVCTAVHGIILWCLLYYLPLYYEAVQGYSPALAGVALFPATFTVAPISIITGLIITKTNSYRWTIWLGWTISTIGLGTATLLEVESTIPQWAFISLVAGTGLGILFPALQFQLQAASSSYNLEFAVAMFLFFRSLGQCLGVAIGGVVFQNKMISELSGHSAFKSQANELAKDAVALIEFIKTIPEETERAFLRTAYTDSLRMVYICLCVLSGLALMLSLCTREYDLNGPLETDQGLVPRNQDLGLVVVREA